MYYLLAFFIFSLIVLIIGIISCQKAQQIRVVKTANQEILNQKFSELTKDLLRLSKEKTQLEQDIANKRQAEETLYNQTKNRILEQSLLFQENITNASEEYVRQLEESYDLAEDLYDKKLQQLKIDEQNAVAALEKIQNSLNAAAKAQLREREKEEKLDFYKVALSLIDMDDVIKLESLKPTLHQPIVLSKLIWTTYFQKQITEMCNRVLGNKTVCGIYKITNLKTKQCYIGQSVDVADRWKQHSKCGLGIEASATNKLYNAMQKDHLWNFTFELLEECPREQLNEKERQWIQMYQADSLGYNTLKGNK